MKKFFFLLLPILLVAGCGKTLGGGFYNAQSLNFQQSYATTTPGAASTTIATIPIAAVTSTIHIVADVAANGTTSTNAGGFHCIADFQRSSSTVDTILRVGTAADCLQKDTVISSWNVSFATSTGNVLVQVLGSGGNTVDWSALIYSINAQ